MRGRAIGLGLLGLGAFLLAGALAVRLFLEPSLVKLPLDQTADPTAVGTDITFFDIGAGEQLTGLEADVRQRVRGDVESSAASEDVAVWNFGSTITSSDGVLLNAGTYRVCVDRREAVAVECEEIDHVDGDREESIEGLTLTFPFGTEQRDYEIFNSTVRDTVTATFEGEEEMGGLDTYRFEVSVPETVIRTTEVPAAMAGVDGNGSVEAAVVYSNERVIWVEPTSGVIVTSEEHPNTVVRGPGGEEGVTLLAGDFAGTDETIASGAERAEKFKTQINLLTAIVPWSMAALGLLLLLLGALLIRRARAGAPHEESFEAAPVREPQVQ